MYAQCVCSFVETKHFSMCIRSTTHTHKLRVVFEKTRILQLPLSLSLSFCPVCTRVSGIFVLTSSAAGACFLGMCVVVVWSL